MENSSFFSLPKPNFFCHDILVQPVTSSFYFADPSSILDTSTAEVFTTYSITPIIISLAPNLGPNATSSAFITALITSI